MVTFCDSCMYVQLATCECCITIQTLVNAIRTYEPGPNFMDNTKITDASGKQDIGGGQSVSITLELQNGWELRAFCGYACQTNVIVRGGNLAFVCCSPPVVPVANVTYVIGNSTSPGLSGTIETDMTKVTRYLTNKKSISGTTLTIFCDTSMCCAEQTYTLDDGDDPKSQTPV